MAIRAALGAGRLRVIRQLLTENLLLSLLGAAAAVVLAVWGIDLLELIRLDSTCLGVKEFRFDRIGDVQIDRGVLGFTILVSVVTGVLFGLIPAVQASRLDINSTLKEDSRSGTPAKAARLFRNTLLISEVSLGIPVLSGRDFTETDTRENPGVAIINQALAEKFFPGQDPVGRHILFRGFSAPKFESEIVGLAGNVRNYSSDGNDQHELHYPFAQKFLAGSEVGPVILIRVQGDTDEMVPAIRNALDGPDPRQQVLIRFRNVQDMLNNSASQERFQAILLGVFSGIALLLAVVGVYGVMSYSTSQRIQEVGIRLALGAQPKQILRTIVGEGVALSAIGIVIGAGISIGLGHLLSTLFFGLESTDAATLATVAVILLFVSTLASLIPVWRAMRVDPLTALRHE